MSQSKKHYSASEWPALLEQWTKSGETAERFAARLGVRPSTLERWGKAVARNARSPVRKKVESESTALAFARVQVVKPPARADGLIEVVMRDGLIVRVHGFVDAETLSAVLGSMSRC